MIEQGIASLSSLVVGKSKIYRLNLRKSGVSVEFGGAKWGECPMWRWVEVRRGNKTICRDCTSQLKTGYMCN